MMVSGTGTTRQLDDQVELRQQREPINKASMASK